MHMTYSRLQAALDTIFQAARQMEDVRPGTSEARQLEGYIMSTRWKVCRLRLALLSWRDRHKQDCPGLCTKQHSCDFSAVLSGLKTLS